jgi:hypothetical protein
MKTSSRLHKIRIIVNDSKKDTYGVSIPESFNRFFNVFVSISEEGDKLILTSGALPSAMSNKEIKSHSIEVSKHKI